MNLDRRVSSFSVILAFVCLAIVGVALIPKLSVKLSPSQSLPQVNVYFSMQGSSPRVVEIEATSKLESMLNRMKGVQEIYSRSGNGWGNITVRFDKHTDIDAARFEVSTIIRQTWPLLPDNVSYPSISLSRADNRANRPFMTYTVNAPSSPLLIQQYAENQIKTKLSQIAGVYKVNVSGASPLEWQLEYDYKQLESLGITPQDIQTAVSLYLNKDFLGVGAVKSLDGNNQWIRIALVPDNRLDEINLNNIEVKNISGKIILLDQLVNIKKVEARAQSFYRINGLNSIYLSITAEETVNQLELSKTIKSEMSLLQEKLPAGYELHLSYDATEYINDELDKIYFRTGLTLIILLLFVLLTYRNIRYTMLIVISLFLNVATAVIFYYLLGLEIQLYSLAGITISLTLIIDNTIVMSDQIIRRDNMKAFLAILAATLTTIASLSIIFFMDEKLRLNLQDFAFVIIINLAISLSVALFLVPALLDKMGILARERRKVVSKKKSNWSLFDKIEIRPKRLNVYFNKAYAALSRFIYRWRVVFIILIILAFGLPVFLLPKNIEGEGKAIELYNKTLGSDNYINKIKPHVDNILGGTLRLFVEKVYEGSYFPDREETSLFVTASLPSNSTIEQMNDLIQRMEAYLSQFPEIRQFQTNINSAQRANISIQFTKEHQKSTFPFLLKSQLITRANELGGGSWGVFGLGDGFSNSVREGAGGFKVEMFGYNYDELAMWAEVFRKKLIQDRRIKEVIINSEFSDYKDDYEEFKFIINKERLNQENIQPYQLYASLSTVFGRNISAGKLYDEKGTEQIFLNSQQADEYDVWNLYNIPIKVNERDYKLSQLVEIKKEKAPQAIVKENQQYKLCLQYEYIGSHEQGNKKLKRNVEEFGKVLPMGYTVKHDTSSRWGKKESKQYWLLLLIFVIIYFISSILFNSLRQPFHIISIIPISFIGIFLTFYLFKLNFDQGGFASFVLLSGLTINANIYIIDEYNNIRKKYKDISAMRAYLRAWNAKIRPIFLTIVSTILGFIPFLIGANKEAFWFPLAAGTIGGLLISFVAIFLFLPLFMGIGKKKNMKTS